MEGDRTRRFCKRWHQERDVVMVVRSTQTSDLRKCPKLSHDVDFSCSYWKVSSISSLNIPREGLMSSVVNLWPTHHPKHIKYWFKQKKKQQNIWIIWDFCCFYFRSLSIGHYLWECSLAETGIECQSSLVSTWAAEPIGNPWRPFVTIYGLVFLSEGHRIQEPIVTGQTKHRVLLTWSMDITCTHLCNTITWGKRCIRN